MDSAAVQKQEGPEEDIFDRYQSLCLKGVALIMLLVHHCFLKKTRYAGFDITFVIPENIWLYVAQYFKICVALFVFVSAYGITKKLMKLQEGSLRESFAQMGDVVVTRLVRLLGGYMFVLLLVDIFALIHDPGFLADKYGTSFFSAMEYWLIDMFGLAELFGTPTLQGAYWYYSLAIVLIILVPVFYLMIQRMGSFLFLGLIFVFNFTVAFPNSNFKNYLLAIAVGVVCARENLITRMVRHRFLENTKANRLVKLFIELILLLGLMALFKGVLSMTLRPLWNAVIPPLVAAFCCEFIFVLPVIGRFLQFTGKHSGNMYLVHSYIRNVWGKNFTYGFHYPLLIVVMLFVTSLAAALIIEGLQRLLRFPQLLRRLEKALTAGNRKLFGEPGEEKTRLE